MVFWIASGGLGVAVAALMLIALLRRRGSGDGPASQHDIQVYRDQLAEIDRDAGRGIVGADDAARLRNEVKRRILESDRSARGARPVGANQGGRGTAAVAVVLVVAGVAAAFGVYLNIGAPGYPDLPMATRIAGAESIRANRPSQAEAEDAAAAVVAAAADAAKRDADPQFLALLDTLRSAVATRPDDLDGQILLARNEAVLGNFTAAVAAQERVIAIRGDVAVVRDYAALADLMIRAAGGYIAPEAEAVLADILARDPLNGTARFYVGMLEGQTGRPDRAFRVWRALLEESAPDAPWVAPIRARISDLAQLAGERYTPPPEGAAPLRGPGSADVTAAEDMSVVERMQMIQGMVGSLSARLADQGGTPEEWAQLIRAHGVLGQAAQAGAVWAEAQAVFVDPGAIDTIRRAAQDAGVAQ